MRFIRLAPVLCVLCLVQGCSEWTNLWNDRYGPAPVADPVEMQKATERQWLVLRAFADGAAMEWPAPVGSPDYWYALTLVGFNVVDDQCAQYMEDLFGWERKEIGQRTSWR